MQNSPINFDLPKYLKGLEKRLSVVENRRPGTIYLDKKIVTKDPETGVETVIGDLSEYGEDRMGIKQFINDIEPPPVPTSPMVATSPGLFTISWDGANRDDLPHAPDFDHLNVYGSDGNSTFLVGSLKNKEEVVIVPAKDYGVKWNFWFTSVDQNGNESIPSNQSIDATSPSLSDAPDISGAFTEVLLKIDEESTKAMTAANGKNRIWSSPSAPVADPNVPFIEGDTWFDTDDGNKIYVWKTSPAPAGWKPAVLDSSALDAKVNNLINTAKTQSDTAIQTANGKNRAYHQNTAPTGTAHTVGDMWFDTANDNRLSKWDGSKWVVTALGSKAISDVVINSITAAQNSATAAKQSADGKNTNYYTTTAPTAPTGGFKTGDTWFDTSNGNRINRWDGSKWVVVPLGTTGLSTEVITSINNAKLAGDNAQQTADQVSQELIDAETTFASEILATSNEAKADAQAKADAAKQAAINAAATDAQTKADAVKVIADAAAQAASDAAGIANGKGKVLVQSTAPGVADRNTNTLWIDTTGGANTPKKWTTGTTWIAVTDKAATDAATAAANAKTAADAADSKAALAQTAAGAAQGTADSALTMAGSKSNVFYSTAVATGTGTRVDDIWRQRDATNQIIGEWRWTGTAWQKVTLTSGVFSNLDAGLLTAGTIQADRIGSRSITAEKILAKSLTANEIKAGSLTSASGIFGTLDASIINAGTINSARLNAGDIRAKFLEAGKITATDMVTGTITADSGIISSLNAGVISTGFLDSERLKAGSITTEHLVVADATNFATIDPQRGIDVSYPTNYATQNDGEWTTNKASSESYLFFRDALGPIPFKTGDKFVLKFTGKATAATTGSIRAYFYPTKGSTSGVVMSSTQTVALTTTAKEFAPMEFTVPNISAFTGSGTWTIGFYGTNARTISVKNVFLLKMVDATVIAPDSISTSHMQANSITAASGIIKDLDASRISTGTMHGKYIQANTLAAEALAIGSLDNLIPEPEFTNGGASWNLISGTSIIPTGSSTGGPALRITANSSHQSINSKSAYQVSGGESYRLTARIKSSATIPAGSVWIAVRARNRATGVETYPYVTNSSSIAANTWTTISDIIEVPDTMDRVSFFISARNTLTTGNLDVEFVSAVRATNTVLIKDGAISASKMELNSITATNGIIASLNASLINYGEMEGKYIKSKTISVDRLLVGSNDNVIPDPQFFNTNNDWGSESAPYSFPQTEGRDGKAAFKIAPTSIQAGRYSQRIPVTGGESYRVSVWVKSNVAIPKGTLGFYLNRTLPGSSTPGGAVNFLKQSDGTVGNDAIAANTWTLLSAVATLPENIATVAFGFYVQTSFSTGTVWFSDAAAFRMGDGNLIVDGSITASAIDAGTITVDKLAIGTSDNMVVDPEFEDSKLMDARFKASSTSVVGPVKTSTIDGRRYVTIPVSTSSLSLKLIAKDSNRYLPVVPGATYKIKYQANVISGSAGTRPVVTTLKADGSSAYTAVNTSSYVAINNSAWSWVEYEWTAPSDAKAAFFDIQRQAGFTGALNVASPSVTRMSSGELIVDGAIDGKTITGALFRTTTLSNRGIKLSTTGLEAFNSVGTRTFFLNPTNGEATFLGKVSSGSTIAGATITGSTISGSTVTAGAGGYTVELGATSDGGAIYFTTPNTQNNGSISSDEGTGSKPLLYITSPTSATYNNHAALTLVSSQQPSDNRSEVIVSGDLVMATGAITGTSTDKLVLSGPSGIQLNNTTTFIGPTYNTGTAYMPGGRIAFTETFSSYSANFVQSNYPVLFTPLNSATPSGDIQAGTLRLTSTSDASETSTAHALQIGPSSGSHLRVDDNEMISMSGSNMSTFVLNGTRVSLSGEGTSSEFGSYFKESNTSTYAGMKVSGGTDGYFQISPLWTTTSGANCYVNSYGTFYRSTSKRENKLSIEDYPSDKDDILLSLNARTWFDKNESEQMAGYMNAVEAGETPEFENLTELRRIPGMVAEEVEAAGLTEFVQYGVDGAVEGLMYDRLGVVLIPVVRRQRDRIISLETAFKELQDRVLVLESSTV